MTAPGGYEALRERAAWLDVSSRGKILVTGEDRARLLHAMTTNNVQALTPGDWCYAYFLSTQGRILGDANILCLPDALLLDTEPESVKKIFDHLEQYIIADDVTLEDQTGMLAMFAVEGPEASALVDAFAPVFPISLTGAGGFVIIAPVAEKARIEHKLKAAAVTAGTPEARNRSTAAAQFARSAIRLGEVPCALPFDFSSPPCWRRRCRPRRRSSPTPRRCSPARSRR